MSSHNYSDNKKFFKYIQQFKYEINKDENNIELLTINYNNKEAKFKYLLLFTEDTKTGKILWSCDNPYSDQKTQKVTFKIKKNIDEKKKFNYESLNNDDLLQLIKLIMKLDNDIEFNNQIIKPIWILNSEYKKYKQYYLITDIIYY